MDGLPAIATACQRVTSELLDLSLARAHGHPGTTPIHGHTGTTPIHGHTGKAHQGTNLNFLFRQFSFGQTKTKIQSKPHLSFEPQSHHSLTSKCVCVSVLWSFLNSLAHCPKACRKNLRETRMTRTQNCRLSWNFGEWLITETIR